MNSFLRKAMLPGAVALAAFGVLGAFGSGVANTQTAHAANLAGDICWADTNATPADPTAFYNNANGPVDYVVNNGDTYGLVFRVADVATSSPDDGDNFTILPNIHIRVDSETGSARISSQAEVQENPRERERARLRLA